MESLKELYRIGPGPSSSHTVAPQNACRLFKSTYPEVLSFDAELFGSLSLTGKGHGTDSIITQTFAPNMCRVTFNRKSTSPYPSGVILRGYDERNRLVATWTVTSLGGGAFDVAEVDLHLHDEVYPQQNMDEILQYVREHKISLSEYVFQYDKDLYGHLNSCFHQMLQTVKGGLRSEGVLPGKLQIKRAARALNMQAQACEDEKEKEKLLLMSYAYAACEENAAGKMGVTAPTMGASGVLAALVYYFYYDQGISRDRLIRALGVAGIFGNVVKRNASISGAISGCQAEVGTACAMGSAFVAFLNGLSSEHIAYAAEIGIEHHLGLTCDPVGGYVIIPCIERNAVAVLRAMDNALLAEHIGSIRENRVSFDQVVSTMNYTGKKLAVELKETSLGGLAAEIEIKEDAAITFSNTEETEQSVMVYPAEEDSILEEERADPSLSYIPEEGENSIFLGDLSYGKEETAEKPVFRKRHRKRRHHIDSVMPLSSEKENSADETITTRTVIDGQLSSQEEERNTTSIERESAQPAAEHAEEMPAAMTELDSVAEKTAEEKEEFSLEDYDLSLLDAFNKTYTLKDAEKEEVDAFMDKLEIKI